MARRAEIQKIYGRGDLLHQSYALQEAGLGSVRQFQFGARTVASSKRKAILPTLDTVSRPDMTHGGGRRRVRELQRIM